jgi:hypothetical protein
MTQNQRPPKNSSSKAAMSAGGSSHHHVDTSNPHPLCSNQQKNKPGQKIQKCSLSQILPASQNFVTSWCTTVLFSTSLAGYTSLNTSQAAANNFKACEVMFENKQMFCYTMFAPVELLHNGYEQQPSNQGDHNSSVMRGGVR